MGEMDSSWSTIAHLFQGACINSFIPRQGRLFTVFQNDPE
jgi:hypothetical protein